MHVCVYVWCKLSYDWYVSSFKLRSMKINQNQHIAQQYTSVENDSYPFWENKKHSNCPFWKQSCQGFFFCLFLCTYYSLFLMCHAWDTCFHIPFRFKWVGVFTHRLRCECCCFHLRSPLSVNIIFMHEWSSGYQCESQDEAELDGSDANHPLRPYSSSSLNWGTHDPVFNSETLINYI